MSVKLEIACDMDGVLADFDGYKRKVWPKGISDEDMWVAIQKFYPYWFQTLPEMSDMVELANFLDTADPNWFVLSALPNPDKGMTQRTLMCKTRWLREHVGDEIPAIFCRRSHKKDWSGPGRVLIDDHLPNIVEWEKAGGIGIMHKSAKDTIAKIKELLNGGPEQHRPTV